MQVKRREAAAGPQRAEWAAGQAGRQEQAGLPGQAGSQAEQAGPRVAGQAEVALAAWVGAREA